MRNLLVVSLAALGVSAFASDSADEALRREAAALFGQVKASTEASSPQAELGRALFWDTRLSSDGKTACASCHPASDWGADRRRFSTDARGALTSRHSPTVFNAMSQPALRWLGDRKNGADQAESSLTGSMGFGSKDIGVAKLAELEYLPKFRTAFPQEAEPLTPANYARAIASYQATLSTPAPFDRFLAGDDAALTESQKAGLRIFVSVGCAGCHNGVNVGGAMMQKFGLMKDYWLETGSDKPDPGRFAITKKEEDRFVFRVPMLRNVAKTAPYFHDGSVADLDRAIRVMATVQLGRTLGEAEVSSIAAFLESLTGNVPSNYAPPGQRPGM
jgi:cytochrome c peroxidase